MHIRYFIGYVYHICLQDTIQSTLSLCLRCQAMLLPMPLRPLLLTTRSGFSLSIPNGSGSLLEKRVFDPFLTPFWSQNGPVSRYFGIFHGPKPVATGSKWAKTTCLSIINGPGSFLKKHVFDPFLTPFWSQNGPFSRHFGIFDGPERATTGSKRLKWSRNNFGKNEFFRPGDPGGPTVGPHCASAGRFSGCTN